MKQTIICGFVGALGLIALVFGSACERLPATEQVQPSEPPKTSESRVTFLAVGDMMISRGVAQVIKRTNNPLTPFQRMESVFRSTDFNFGNLEVPISGKDNIFGKEFNFNMHTSHVAGLKEYNFKVLNLANNHAMDQGAAGLRHTQKFLAERDFTVLGVGENLDQAWQPKIVVANGVKVGFVGASYASFNDGGAARNNYVARIEDKPRLKQAIERLKAEGADFVVATMHAGVEYTRRPHQPQIDFARAAIDYGADLVVGAHPHWAQTFEVYKGKYVFYSLGNFIFDQDWSRDTKEGLALKITLHNQKSVTQTSSVSLGTRLEQIELIPVIIENYSTPRLASETEAEQFFRKIGTDARIIKPRSASREPVLNAGAETVQ